MALIEFKNLPDTSTPLNAENLNNNFNDLKNKIENITVLYTGDTATNTLTLSQSIFDFSIVIVKIKNASTLLIGAVDKYKKTKIFRPTAMQFNYDEIYFCGLNSQISNDGKTLTIQDGCMYYYALIGTNKTNLDTVEYVIGVI